MGSNVSFSVRHIMAKLFTFIFLTMTVAILYSLVTTLFKGISSGDDVMQMFLKAVNTGIIALAVFELALVINAEYSAKEDSADPVESIRRTIPRFIGTVCIALSLEGLIMVIKYSQLELAGNLYYPVAIISSTAFLLIALGVFLFLTQPQHKPKVEN